MIDELINQFTQNKYVLAHLIEYRHSIRNLVGEETIDKSVAAFVAQHQDQIASKDYAMFEDTAIAKEARIVWESLDQTNKAILWKWICFICSSSSSSSS